MSIPNIIKIAKKELIGYLNTPTTYVVLIGFLILWQFFFFKSFFLVGQASARNLFAILPWFFIFIVPAFTMSAFSSEQKEGTIEVLLTKPISEAELVIGKFAAILALLGTTILLTLTIPLSASNFGSWDWGVTFCQYFGAILALGLLTGLGLYISSLTKNQILALLSSAAIVFLLIIAGQESAASNLPPQITVIAQQLSLNPHLQAINRGVIDSRDLIYFVSTTAVFLVLTQLSLLKNKMGNQTKTFTQASLGTAILIVLVILVNLAGAQLPGRLDLTKGQLYTLSASTKKILRGLPDIVNITFYQSLKLPEQVSPIARDVNDLILDYKKESRGKINISIKHPDKDIALESEAVGLGITPLEFNVVSQQEYQIKKGFLGISISYLDNQEAIPVVSTTDDLEYQLTSLISQMTIKEKEKILFISGHGEKTTFSDLATYKKELSKQYEVSEQKLDEEDPKIPQNTKAVILAGPTDQIPEKEQEEIINYVKNGGALLALIDTVTINPQVMSAYDSTNSGKEILEALGVVVENDIIYDLASNESVNLGGAFPIFVRYPMWLRAVADSSLKIDYVTLPWPSSLHLKEDILKEAVNLLSSTKHGGRQKQNFDINPNQQWNENDPTQYILAIQGKVGEGRVAVVGDSDFLTENFVQNAPGNLPFAINSVGWLVQNQNLSEIITKNRLDSVLTVGSSKQASLLEYGNITSTAGIVVIFGIVWAITRGRRIKQRARELASF